MSPYAIDVLLHYHCTRGSDHAAIVTGPAAWRDTIAFCLAEDLLQAAPSDAGATYAITERGRFYVTDGLCAIPLPVQRWEIPAK